MRTLVKVKEFFGRKIPEQYVQVVENVITKPVSFEQRIERYFGRHLGYPIRICSVKGTTWLIAFFPSHICRRKLKAQDAIGQYDEIATTIKHLKIMNGNALIDGAGI